MNRNITLPISTAKELMDFAHAANKLHNQQHRDLVVTLTADIDLGGVEWTPICNGGIPFYGTFDGGGHTIRGLTIQKKGPGNFGLFGEVCGTVQNLTVAGELQNLAGDPHSAVGGIAGELSGGVIRNCAADFAVNGGGEPLGLFAGGVAGLAEANSLIQNCRSSVRAENIQGSLLYLGGIVGALLDSRAEDCAFDGALPALDGEGQTIHAGAIAGNVQGTSTLVNRARRGTADGNCLEQKEAKTR